MDHEHLLSDEKSTTVSEDDEQPTQRSFRQKNHQRFDSTQFPWTAIIIHAGIFATYTILLSLYAAWIRKTSGTRSPVAYAPFTAEPQAVIFDHEHSVFVGDPSPELDDAWAGLLKNTNVRITEEEMDHLPDRKHNSIPLPEGGYYATLNAYHNLHCVKRLHHYMYEDHYFPNITRREKAANKFHSHHCLDMLRQTVMCQADTQVLTMKWRTDSRVPTANWTAPHRCLNWNQVEEWAANRRIASLMKPGYLNHPTLGPAYPNGRGNLIGETLPPEVV